jgi:prepilin-type processing-associated H-X9-DG protein
VLDEPGHTVSESRGYFINRHVSLNSPRDTTYDGVTGRLGSIPNPSELGVIFELWLIPGWAGWAPTPSPTYAEHKFGVSRVWAEEFGPHQSSVYDGYVTAYRHARGAMNILFADSHVEPRLDSQPSKFGDYDVPPDVIWYWTTNGNPYSH